MNLPLSVSLHDLDACPEPLLAQAEGWLAPDQRARAHRFVTTTLRRRFIAAQAGLLRHLAARLGCAPDGLGIARDELGKPHLPDHPWLHFNLSHSAGWALVASAGTPVGVDIESTIPAQRFEVASTFLDPTALLAWQGLAENLRSAALTEAWCAREAVLKLDGRGLALDPRTLRLPQQLPGWAEWDSPARCGHVQTLPAPAGFHACLASLERLPAVQANAAPCPW